MGKITETGRRGLWLPGGTQPPLVERLGLTERQQRRVEAATGRLLRGPYVLSRRHDPEKLERQREALRAELRAKGGSSRETRAARKRQRQARQRQQAAARAAR